MYSTATNYFSTLSDLMRNMEVADKHGLKISVDQGADQVVELVLQIESSGGKVMLVGNGGSAAMVSHAQNDLFKRAGVKSMVFTEQPLLLALANDNGYESVFEWPVQQWAQPGDLLIAVSSSGRSENILRAARASLTNGCQLVTLSGFERDNPLRQMGDLNFYVNSNSYGYVETAHAALTHFVTDRAMILKDPEAKH